MQLCRQRPGSLMRRLVVASVLGSAVIVVLHVTRARDDGESDDVRALGPRSGHHHPAKGSALTKDRTKVRLFGEWQGIGEHDDDGNAVRTQRRRRKKKIRPAVDGTANDWRGDDDSKTERQSHHPSAVVLDRRMLLSHGTKMTQSSGRRRPPRRSNTTSLTGVTVHKAFDAESIPTASQLVVGVLRGGPGKCTVYDVRADIARKSDADFSQSECVKLRVPPTRAAPPSGPVLVCPHPDSVDEHLSKPLRAHGVWKPNVVRVFVAAIEGLVSSVNSSSLAVGVYDIGANVGQYSLLAAGFFRCRVVAVEPFKSNIYRLHKAVQLNGLGDQIVVVQNAVSNVRDTFELELVNNDPSRVSLTSQDADRYCDEPGCPAHATTIFIDDLLEVTNFDVAVMKIYVEGSEHRAFAQADQLLTEVRVAYIFMEWVHLKDYHVSKASEDKDLVQRMVDSLTTKHGYTPYGLDNQVLKLQNWYRWPPDVVWVHSTVTPPRALVNAMTSQSSPRGDQVV